MSGVTAVIATQQFNYAGEPLANGTLTIYAANTATLETTWADQAQTIVNTNPLTLNAQGECVLWLDAGKFYDMVLKDSLGATINTFADVTGAASITPENSEWTVSSLTPTYISTTSFSLVGNLTSLFSPRRRIRCTVGAGFVYGTIVTSVFSTVTTISIAFDSTLMDASLSAVDYGILSPLPIYYLLPAGGTYGSVQTITVDTATGIASPLNPFVAGNPFNTLANALAFANQVSQSYQGKLNVVLTAGQTHTLAATTEIYASVSITSSVASSTATISGAFLLRFRDDADLTDITFTNTRVELYGSPGTILRCAFNAATNTTVALLVSENASINVDACTFPRGTVTVSSNSYLSVTGNITLTDGTINVSYSSAMDVSGNLTVTTTAAGVGCINLTHGSALSVGVDTSITTATATYGLFMNYMSSALFTGNFVTAITGSGVCINIVTNCTLTLNGATLTLSCVASNVMSSRSASSIFVNTGVTFTLPAAGKNINATVGSLISLRSVAAGATYTPALETMAVTGSIISVSAL
jgi:hypothetical protein